MLIRIFTFLAVAALAISTWILSGPHRRGVVPPEVQAALPGYYLKGATLTDYDLSGDPSLRIQAERIDQIDHGPEVALYHVRFDYQAPNGQAWVMFGDTAHVEPGGNVVDVAGNVRIQGQSTEHQGTAVIHTETLRYDVPQGIASTPSDVRVEFGAHTLTARGLVANLKDRTLHLESKVNGRFQP
ncbi:MAG TPA: LPS export ABC transporter periplasmic protein LptC [Steroidobacteraceae bacterium]|nr:LPS export ABC transporter periplasmic protein LptC [Steroidobacteraceae bacterium]